MNTPSLDPLDEALAKLPDVDTAAAVEEAVRAAESRLAEPSPTRSIDDILATAAKVAKENERLEAELQRAQADAGAKVDAAERLVSALADLDIAQRRVTALEAEVAQLRTRAASAEADRDNLRTERDRAQSDLAKATADFERGVAAKVVELGIAPPKSAEAPGPAQGPLEGRARMEAAWDDEIRRKLAGGSGGGGERLVHDALR